jgi:hypothetical protein
VLACTCLRHARACVCIHTHAQQVNSLQDMQRFVLQHSDFSRAQGNVTKHVSIVTQLSEVVAARHLMDVSTVRASVLVLAAAAAVVAACQCAWLALPLPPSAACGIARATPLRACCQPGLC